MLGERLKAAIKQKEQGDVIAQKLLEQLAEDVQTIKTEPQRLGLSAVEYALFAVIRDFAPESTDEASCIQAARTMVNALKEKKYMPSGWSTNKGGRNQVTLTLQITSWGPGIQELNLCPTDLENPPFLAVAVEELSKVNP
jgi:hypothetical protein